MLLLLMTVLSSLALHSTTAYSARELYENDLTEQAREAIAQVIGSISRPTKQQEADISYTGDLVDLLLRPNERLEKDLTELRFLIDFFNTQAQLDSGRRRGHPRTSRPEQTITVPDGDDLTRPITVMARSCMFRLGGHCNTEHLDKAMRQKAYLASSDSPGRKRRSLRDVLTNQISRK
ncbi:hypothetical protein EGW08_010914 [Elysia chlorotica]|uniref:Calcitonin peptide-like domain-containing protein n=1 Tax=Elysia chlorotica TaxID=188477 RepID=A0A3S1BI66_ELYCH|nr:hypothetical protein EGW08_010914 [Elysia chlorotica]